MMRSLLVRRTALALCLSLTVAACSGAESGLDDSPQPGPSLPDPAPVIDFGTPPSTPSGDLDRALAAALDRAFYQLLATPESPELVEIVEQIGSSGDPRLAWLLGDLLRFAQSSELA